MLKTRQPRSACLRTSFDLSPSKIVGNRYTDPVDIEAYNHTEVGFEAVKENVAVH